MTLGRALDPRAWLSKLANSMKHEVFILEDREFIRRARRDGREARGNEGREKRGLRKGAERG